MAQEMPCCGRGTGRSELGGWNFLALWFLLFEGRWEVPSHSSPLFMEGRDVCLAVRGKVPRGVKASFLDEKGRKVRLTSGKVDFLGVVIDKTRERPVLTIGSVPLKP